MEVILAEQQHGKLRVRLGRTWREGQTHHFVEWNVSTTLESDMAHAYHDGTNTDMTATDTQKNTVRSPLLAALMGHQALHFAKQLPSSAQGSQPYALHISWLLAPHYKLPFAAPPALLIRSSLSCVLSSGVLCG